jgi:hypothetical protein
MQRYKNLNGTSGIRAYQIGAGSISVQFSSGHHYLYTDLSAGPANIAEMQRLAAAGCGLSTFISRVIRDGYACKWS